MSASSPFQWNGSVPRSPVCSDCVRRAPAQTKFQTRPSSSPSAWHDAHAMPPPALAWKTRWPVSARLVVDSVTWRAGGERQHRRLARLHDQRSVARERDGDRLADDLRDVGVRAAPHTDTARSVLPTRSLGRQRVPTPLGATPVPSTTGAPTPPRAHGAVRAVGLAADVAVGERCRCRTRTPAAGQRDGVIVPVAHCPTLVALPIDTNATRLPSAEMATSTASTSPASAAPAPHAAVGDHVVTVGCTMMCRGRSRRSRRRRQDRVADAALVQHHHAAVRQPAIFHATPAVNSCPPRARQGGEPGRDHAPDTVPSASTVSSSALRKRLTRRRGPSTTTSRRSRSSAPCAWRRRRRPAG